MAKASNPTVRFVSWLTFMMICAFGVGESQAVGDEMPRVFILHGQNLVETKKRIQSGDTVLAPAFKKLTREADRALGGGSYSVVNKERVPPSGDKHDYMSIVPYWWPNPSTSNGLPYVRRDGEVNPERDEVSDRKKLDNLVQRVKTLALGYFFAGRQEYAAQAAKLLRVWFLDEATKMNPHLRYAQAVPGRSSGRGAGIIETHNLPELIDAVGMLAGSKSWSERDQRDLQKWFEAYLTWLRESSEGGAEAGAQNNHGTWYDVQSASYALFCGKHETAKEILNDMAARRIAKQIESDGRQPRELERTRAWTYSLFNLEALFGAASIAEKLGIDLWSYHTADGRSIRKALDWLVPFATGEKKWGYPQISGWQPEKLAPLLRRAALQFRDAPYEVALLKLSRRSSDSRGQLLYPLPESSSLLK